MLNLHSPLDMHVHLRQGDMLGLVAPYTARDFAAAVVMPNLTPPVTSLAQVLDYRQAILRAASDSFTPLMTLFSGPTRGPSLWRRGRTSSGSSSIRRA